MDDRTLSLRGLKAAIFGSVIFVTTMLLLEVSHDWASYLGMDASECPNAGANGNAGPFAYSVWETVLPLACMVWLAALITEQVLPETWEAYLIGT